MSSTIQVSFLMLKRFLHKFLPTKKIMRSLKVSCLGKFPQLPPKKIMVRPLVRHGSYPCGHSQTVLLIVVHSFFVIFPFLQILQLSHESVDFLSLNVMPSQHSVHCAPDVLSPASLYPQFFVNSEPGAHAGHCTQPVPFL